MKKLLLVCGIVATSFLFSSCLSPQSLTQNLNSNQTTVVLSQANYKVVGTAKGEAKGSPAALI